MQQVRVQPSDGTTDLHAFRQVIHHEFRGDARPRPLDCTGKRFLVRDEKLEVFRRAAARCGLEVIEDAPVPQRVR